MIYYRSGMSHDRQPHKTNRVRSEIYDPCYQRENAAFFIFFSINFSIKEEGNSVVFSQTKF